MTFLVVLALLVAVALAAGWFGADSRPRGDQPPEPQWPFNDRRGPGRRCGPLDRTPF